MLKIDRDAGGFNFIQAVNAKWDKVCFFGPYSTNATAKEVLGFDWDLEANSRINLNDGITLAVFTGDSSVVAYKEISRYTDFSQFSGECFRKENSEFEIKSGKVTHAS
ncbi:MULTISPECIES: hypothetical protein [Motilimonas]|uniref:Uncharacterized protein n=1 Tax=Motilimonas cestriensis TaxID=2742685 RepID=A0ABS8WBJ4_9GAMM|nr:MULTISPECIES: hypothetical protein [Motilimonas]MCE0559376.1 hypothetical protein [Motilimonas sp. E26]MCE2596379.1 hypothetical protein [Motilimonas cestriensis]